MDRRRHALLSLLLLLLAAAGTGPVVAGVSGGGLWGGSAEDQLLDAEDAFRLGVERQADSSWVLHWTIADDYYMYRDRFEIELVDGGDAALGEPRFPRGIEKTDPFFGEVEVYYDSVQVRQPFSGDPSANAYLRLTYQGCNEPLGVCYPPTVTEVALAGVGGPGSAGFDAGQGASPQDRIAGMLADRAVWWTALAFIGFGLLLTLTPCVFPMVPILASVIAGDRQRTGTARAGWLSALFVLSMSATYALVGVVVGLTGASIQAWFQQPAVLIAFAAVFALLALAMFGLFDLQLPAGARDRLERVARRMPGGTAGSAIALGGLSAIIVGPCVTPPLIGALLYIAETGDPVTGGVALFALGLGMGIPLVAVGASAGRLLPHAGPWMKAIRAVFGVLLLGLAIWLLQRVVPVQVSMVLWAVLLIISGVQLGALSGTVTGGWPRLWKGVGVIMLVYGVMLLVGAGAGSQSLLQPLRGVVQSPVSDQQALQFQEVRGLDGVREALTDARRDGRTVMVDVSAEWCVSCKELEAFTFPAPVVREALGDTMLLRVDVTRNDERDREFLQRFGIFGPPAILFFGPDGVERRGHRVVGFVPPERFAAKVDRALPEVDS